MIHLIGRAIATGIVFAFLLSDGSAQPYYSTLDQNAQTPAQTPAQRRGLTFSAGRATSNFFRRGRFNSPTFTPAPSTPEGESGATPAQNADPSLGPSSKAQAEYEEYIPPTENPGPRAATTIPAPAGGAVSQLNRRINFPRDRADDLDVLKLQVFLDYHGYSVGEIDGQWGYNTERALYVYQKNNSMPQTGQLDDRMLSRINAFQDGFLLDYTISHEDLKGPFYAIPREYYAQAKMKYLPYERVIEELGEKFHCSPTLLRKLNAGVDFDQLQPGMKILGLNVVDGIDEKRGSVATVRVSKANKWMEAFDSAGRFMFYYPSTLGSQYDPLPIGTYHVTGVVEKPPFKYQPRLFWDANKNDPEAMIPPGPNCPVGVVWIGTSRPSVGIHGTPNPEFISKNTSHGCLRLTNWDALQLAARVREGTKLEFVP